MQMQDALALAMSLPVQSAIQHRSGQCEGHQLVITTGAKRLHNASTTREQEAQIIPTTHTWGTSMPLVRECTAPTRERRGEK
jgi:hypothetical protein